MNVQCLHKIYIYSICCFLQVGWKPTNDRTCISLRSSDKHAANLFTIWGKKTWVALVSCYQTYEDYEQMNTLQMSHKFVRVCDTIKRGKSSSTLTIPVSVYQQLHSWSISVITKSLDHCATHKYMSFQRNYCITTSFSDGLSDFDWIVWWCVSRLGTSGKWTYQERWIFWFSHTINGSMLNIRNILS